LAGSGIFNTGATTITGDVGSSPTVTAPTGFTLCPGAADCVSLTGVSHTAAAPNDGTTVGAKADLTLAYDNAFLRVGPTAVATELAGQTLPAGVYRSASGTFDMTGTLILDGENNADAVFIFQTGSTLTVGGALPGNVSLIRGAQDCNIFWQVGSAATLKTGSTFRGTILAHDDITLLDSVTVYGRLLAGEQASGLGEVHLLHDTIIAPTTCTSQSTLDAAAAAAVAAAAAANRAAEAAAAAQAAADKAKAAASAAIVAKDLADKAAADKAAADAAAAAQIAVDAAAKAAASAAAAAAAAEAAKVEAARVAAADAATAAAVAAKAASDAQAAAARAAKAAKTAAAKAAAKKTAAKALAAKKAKQRTFAKQAVRRAGFTG
jgi:hypothetical protein